MILRTVSVVLLISATVVPTIAQSMPTHVNVFVSGTEGYFAYRFPAIKRPTCSTLPSADRFDRHVTDSLIPGYPRRSSLSHVRWHVCCV